ncbi:MAG: UPF0175 family protein [Planctomycetes bacterium]|nr:UPF0175 family protein [Planctomycetota bacterium]
MTTVTLQLPNEIFALLRQSPGELAKDLQFIAAIEWYRRGLVSQGRAAELAGVARADFIAELASRKIEVFHVDIEDLKGELNRE